jgi:hypothetical protein
LRLRPGNSARIEGTGGAYSIDHSVKSYLVDQAAHVVGSIDPQTPEQEQLKALARLLVRRQRAAPPCRWLPTALPPSRRLR